MAKKNTGTFIIDDDVSKELREEISDQVLEDIGNMKSELAEREPILDKRRDFFEGRHHKYTNVIGQSLKQQEGHIQAVFNYIYKFCTKLHQSLTNSLPRIKIKSRNEADPIETARAEAVEDAIYKILNDNFFFNVLFKRTSINQIRDADFCLHCEVVEDEDKGRRIEISHVENMAKLMVFWDDQAGTSFSGIAFKDMWTLSKIKRTWGYTAEAYQEKPGEGTEKKGSHLNDQFGMFSTSNGTSPSSVPTGENKIPKAEVIPYWGYHVIDGKVKVLNLIYINRELVQFVVTDYKEIPWWVGHSFISTGKPWSVSFIDALGDPQIELNDRTGEEGDMIRIGAHMKFVAINMPDFDADSIKPGTGQVIYIEGENADFKPLTPTTGVFPSESYINRVLDHLHNIGLPKIALSSGSAPYTGRVAAIQYQPIVDLVTDLRIQHEIVFIQLIKTIQQYLIDYFPEMETMLTEHIMDDETGESYDGEMVIRDIEFDWENVLPLSRSDKVVDASTLYDRHAISTHTYLGESGFRNPSREIKKLKEEAKDPEMMALREKFSQFSTGAVKATIDAQKTAEQEAEKAGITQQQIDGSKDTGTPKANAPILTSEQNDGKRGVMTGTGTPTGQTASLKGNVAQTTQNINAQQGV